MHPAPAFELKFLIAPEVAEEVRRFALAELAPDPHGDPREPGQYETTTLYLDTPGFDVFHRAPGFRRRKYRLRRYGREPAIWLERKSRRGDQVRKERVVVEEAALAHLARPGANGFGDASWFHEEIQERGLRPAALLSYRRNAFVGASEEGPLRLTLDRALRGRSASEFAVPSDAAGAAPPRGFLEEAVICELKFRAALPAMFKRLVAELRLAPANVSKYRRLMALLHGTPIRETPDA
jgi:hypothetical protein